MKLKSFASTAFVTFIGIVGSANAAPLVTNGSFEQGTFIGGSFGFPLAQEVLAGDSTTLPGWTATSELAWFASGQAGITVTAGMLAVDLTGFCDLGNHCGTVGAYGGVTQTVTTVKGQTYTLNFLAGNYSLNTGTQPTIDVTIAGALHSFLLPSTSSRSGVWDPESVTFIYQHRDFIWRKRRTDRWWYELSWPRRREFESDGNTDPRCPPPLRHWPGYVGSARVAQDA
jgi:hypothetical protein